MICTAKQIFWRKDVTDKQWEMLPLFILIGDFKKYLIQYSSRVDTRCSLYFKIKLKNAQKLVWTLPNAREMISFEEQILYQLNFGNPNDRFLNNQSIVN